jgi:hypothetical protein
MHQRGLRTVFKLMPPATGRRGQALSRRVERAVPLARQLPVHTPKAKKRKTARGVLAGRSPNESVREGPPEAQALEGIGRIMRLQRGTSLSRRQRGCSIYSTVFSKGH